MRDSFNIHLTQLHKNIIVLFLIASSLVIQIVNVQPTQLFALGGAIGGLFIIYVCPLGIHYKALRCMQQGKKLNEHYSYLKDRNIENFTLRYILYGIVWAFGVFVFVLMIFAFAGVDL